MITIKEAIFKGSNESCHLMFNVWFKNNNDSFIVACSGAAEISKETAHFITIEKFEYISTTKMKPAQEKKAKALLLNNFKYE